MKFEKILKVFLLFFAPFSMSAKIYDCFMFNHEFDVLEIRLNELYDFVDHFVLVECNETQRGETKPFYFEMYKDRFQKFADKMIHIAVHERIHTNNLWERENYQRNQISRGLGECVDDDIIIISDLDEIVRGKNLQKILQAVQIRDIVACQLDLFVYYLNGFIGQWNGPVVTTFRRLKQIAPQGARDARNHLYTIANAGWHFSTVGNVDEILKKWDSNLHGSEFSYSKELAEGSQRGTACIPIDSLFPQYVIDNQKMLGEKGFIKSECTITRESIGFRMHW